MLLGLTFTNNDIIKILSYVLLAGATTTLIIPLMMLITLFFKSFIPPMIIAISGIIPNAMIYHWKKLYLSPWAIPESIVLTKAGYVDLNIYYPLISMCIYFFIFMSTIIIYFHTEDQHV